MQGMGGMGGGGKAGKTSAMPKSKGMMKMPKMPVPEMGAMMKEVMKQLNGGQRPKGLRLYKKYG